MNEGFVYVQPDDANVLKTLPSLSNRELRSLFRASGVIVSSLESFISNFDVWLHSKGRLFYRLKPGHTIDDYFLP